MAAPIMALSEVAVLLLQMYFNLMKMSGRTEKEIDALFKVEKEKFEQNRPELLPKPPE